MRFDLAVPAYNEAPIIGETLARLTTILERNYSGAWRILVCDNASTDNTADIVEGLRDSRYVVIRLSEKGKGTALIAGARASNAELFGFVDADLSADPNDLPKLVTLVQNGEADIAIGSRLLDQHLVRRGMLRTLSSKIFNWIRWSMLGVRVADSQCGMKVMNARGRDVLRMCRERKWFIDVELLARAESIGLSIREVPIHWNEYQYPGRASKLHVVRDGFAALSAFLRIKKRLGQMARHRVQ